MGPAFDVIMESYKETKDGEVKYYYRCNGDSEKYLLKSRGYDLKPVEPADGPRVWNVIKSTGGQTTTKEIKE
jgi:hypothetical protein